MGQNGSMSQGALEFDEQQESADATLTVSQLIDEINGSLADRFGRGVWVSGEIKGFRPATGKHL